MILNSQTEDFCITMTNRYSSATSSNSNKRISLRNYFNRDYNDTKYWYNWAWQYQFGIDPFSSRFMVGCRYDICNVDLCVDGNIGGDKDPVVSCKFGYSFNLHNRFQLTPQIGLRLGEDDRNLCTVGARLNYALNKVVGCYCQSAITLIADSDKAANTKLYDNSFQIYLGVYFSLLSSNWFN